MFLNWLRQIGRALSVSLTGSRRSRPPQRTTRLQLEILEDRLVPATRTWDGGAVSNDWTNAANWVGNVAPVAGDDLVFPASAPDKTADNTFASGTSFNSITLGGGYTLRGTRITLGGGGIIDNSGTSDIIKLDITLGGATRTITVGAGSTLFIDGAIGGAGLVKQGAGNLSLRANNTYSGLTQVSAGRLFVTKDDGLGSTAAGTTVKTGAELIADHSATLIGTLDIDEPITLEGGSKLRALRQVELNGSITLPIGTATISQEGATEELFIDGPINGPGGLNLVSQNKLWLRGSDNNFYDGSTSVTGDVRLDKSQLRAPFGGDVVIQANSSVTLMNDEQLSALFTAITVNAGGTLRLNGHYDEVGSLNLNGGEVTTGVTGALVIDGDITATSTASSPARIDGHIRIAESHLHSLSRDHTVTVADGPLLVDVIVDGTLEGSGNLIKEGNGTLELSVHPGPVFPQTGSVSANTGILLFNGELSGVVYVRSRLSGTGKIENLSWQGGMIAPGPLNNPGILHLNDSLAMSPGHTFVVRLNGPVAGTGHDQLDFATPAPEVDNTVIISGAILVASVGAGASPGDQFRIINNDGTDPVVFNPHAPFVPGFIDPATGDVIDQGEIFTTASGVRLSMDYEGGTGNDVVLTYVNTRTAVEDLAVTPAAIREGQSVLVTGHLTDPDLEDRLTLLVNWGDGTPTARFHPGRDPFALRHTYRDNGDYTPHLTWFDNHGAGNSRDLHVRVDNVAPDVTANDISIGGILVQHVFFVDPGTDKWTATVNYGDGSGNQPLRILPGRQLVLNHRYAQLGSFSVTVTIRDDDGGVGFASFTVHVSPLPGRRLGKLFGVIIHPLSVD